MSDDIFFASIKGFRTRNHLEEVSGWLEKNVVLGHGEADAVGRNLPFEIPMGYPSKAEAMRFTQKLEELGCIMSFESLAQKREREAQEAAIAAAAAAAAEKALEEKQVQQELSGKQKKSKKQGGSDKKAGQDWTKIGLMVAVAVLGILVVWMGLKSGGGNSDDEELSVRYSAIDKSPVMEMQAEAGSAADFSQVVGNMAKFIDKQNYSQEEREQYSDDYYGEVQGAQPQKNRQVRNRNIMLIRVSLAFYNKNKDAWRRLIAEYHNIGANLKVKELVKEMDDIFGVKETVEILGMLHPKVIEEMKKLKQEK